MPRQYRAYEVGRDGRIMRRVDIISEHEDGARYEARKIIKGLPVELWEGSKLLARFEPQAPCDPPA